MIDAIKVEHLFGFSNCQVLIDFSIDYYKYLLGIYQRKRTLSLSDKLPRDARNLSERLAYYARRGTSITLGDDSRLTLLTKSAKADDFKLQYGPAPGHRKSTGLNLTIKLSGKPTVVNDGVLFFSTTQIHRLDLRHHLLVRYTFYFPSLNATHSLAVCLSEFPVTVTEIRSGQLLKIVYGVLELPKVGESGVFRTLHAQGEHTFWDSLMEKLIDDGTLIVQIALMSLSICASLCGNLPGGLSKIVDGLNRMVNEEVSGVKLVVFPQEDA
ncbi:hypothetical protein BDP27DRAFT_1370646 [Rhodocollybia butyracea]|uniref:Uncharacterized protein n=1 Tax=Rhodocollybia butyracea TaxID=206335 RepID=A0A9P5PBK9_9AGAR|nr:hypothetical protein BDP27DRAFT_1370646 [Rhodocollybia butyracea]